MQPRLPASGAKALQNTNQAGSDHHFMSQSASSDPLHGVTLEKIVTTLSEHYGWLELGRIIDIRCFNFDPSVQSSLKFLRKTPWARKKVEVLYVRTITPR